MSHTTRRKAGLVNADVIQRAAKRIGAKYKGVGKTQQYNRQTLSGHRLEIPGFEYDVVIDTKSGDILSDTWGGRWGDDSKLDELQQGYAVEAGKMDAERKGHAFQEIPLDDGSIKCLITIGGGIGAPELGGSGGGDFDAIGGPSL